jgi:hypothetical protein
MKAGSSMESAGALLGMVSNWCFDNDMKALEVFIQDPNTKQVFRCTLTLKPSNMAEMKAVQDEAAKQRKRGH